MGARVNTMTFLAPSFIFVFLPIALSAYSLIPKYLKAYSLPLIGCIFYTVLNLNSTFALVALPVIFAAVSVSVELYKRRRIRVGLNVCRILCIFAMFSILVMRIIDRAQFTSGIGVILILMSAISICSDILWKNGRVPDTFWDIAVYLTFFPLFFVGPFIKYGDFVEKIDHLEHSIENFTSGAIRFVGGFIKCVAVSAVLGGAYNGLFAATEDSVSFITAAIMLVIQGLRFFFFLSGYSDMAVGLSSMFGIRVARDCGNCFCNATPCEYIRNLLSSLLDFCRSYITVPVCDIVSGVGGKVVAAVFAAFFYALIFSKNMETVYTLMIPLSVAMLFIVFRTGKKRRGIPLIPKIIGCVLTFIFSAAVLWYIDLGGPDNTVRVLGKMMSTDAFYIPPHAIPDIGDTKYVILPVLVGAAVWFANRLFKRDNDYLDSKQQELELAPPNDGAVRLTFKYAVSAVLLTLFVFSLTILLPQYPQVVGANFFFPLV